MAGCGGKEGAQSVVTVGKNCPGYREPNLADIWISKIDLGAKFPVNYSSVELGGNKVAAPKGAGYCVGCDGSGYRTWEQDGGTYGQTEECSFKIEDRIVRIIYNILKRNSPSCSPT